MQSTNTSLEAVLSLEGTGRQRRLQKSSTWSACPPTCDLGEIKQDEIKQDLRMIVDYEVRRSFPRC